MKKQFKSAILLVATCGIMALASNKPLSQPATGKLYAGLGYAASATEQSAGAGLTLSIWGVAHSAISGAAYGAVFGGPAGIAVGIGIGL